MKLKDNSVIIFKNDKKNGEKQPDYKGQINVDGKLLDIALWVRQGKSSKFFAGIISEPYKKAEPPESNVYQRSGKYDKHIDKEQIQDDTPGDDLPFD